MDHKHKTVTFWDADTAEEPTADDASSICNSPSWEAFGQNKKKEKKNEAKMRKREKEQAEKEAKSVKKKLAAKLGKIPAAATSSSRPPSASRSVSSPIVFNNDRLRSSSAQAFYEPPPSLQTQHARQRSDSVAMQLKAALTGHKPLGQFKSNNNEEQHFVGGLKLEQERQASAGMPLRKPAPPVTMMNQRAHSFDPETRVPAPGFIPPDLPRSVSDGPQIAGNERRDDPSLEPKTPTKIPSWSQHLVSPTAPPLPDVSKILQWNGNTAGQQNPVTDDEELEPHYGLRDVVVEQERGRRRESYVHKSRQQSRERSINGYKDEVRVSSAKSHYPPQSNRQHQHRAFSSSESSPLAGNVPPRNGSFSNLGTYNEQAQTDDFMITFRLPHTPSAQTSPRQGSFDHSMTQKPPMPSLLSREIPLPPQRLASRERQPTTPGAAIRSFKDAAKAAFHKVSGSGSFRPPVPSTIAKLSRDTTMTPDSVSSSHYSTDEPSPLPAQPFRPFAELSESSIPSRDSSARPTDRSSLSSRGESMRSPSPATSPESSRAHSEKDVPPLGGELGRVDNETVVVSDDTRSYRLSHTATLTTSPTVSNPRISLPPQIPVQNHESHLSELEELVRETFRRNSTLDDAEDSDSSQGCLTPTQTDGSQASALASPLTSASMSSPQQFEPKEQQKEVEEVEEVEDVPQMTPEDVQPPPVQRYPSLSRSHSSPDLALDMSFLPKLKHQPLVPRPLAPTPPPRSSKRGPVNSTAKAAPQSALSSDAPPRAAVVSYKAPPNPSSYLKEARKSMPVPQRSSRVPRASIVPANGKVEPVAKMLVECCNCKFLHDMPSKVYECMANPDGMVEDVRLGVSGAISTTVKCPWCSHGMTTRCCAGYAAVIYLKEKLH